MTTHEHTDSNPIDPETEIQAALPVQPYSVAYLLEHSNFTDRPAGTGQLLEFDIPADDSGNKPDVYNPTPFRWNDTDYLAARVEPHDDEAASETRFFQKDADGVWRQDPDAPVFQRQDPFTDEIGDQLIFGGVRVFKKPNENILDWLADFYTKIRHRPDKLAWLTELYATDQSDLRSLTSFFEGPVGMKDIRPCDLGDRVAISPRPQGIKGGLGKAALMVVNNMSEVTARKLSEAPIIPGLFIDGVEWGGFNKLYRLRDLPEEGRFNEIGFLGHIACKHDSQRWYYPMTGIVNTDTLEVREEQIIASRIHDFPHVKGAKAADINHVLFPGALVFDETAKTADLYTGIGDMYCGIVPNIPHPFPGRIITEHTIQLLATSHELTS